MQSIRDVVRAYLTEVDWKFDEREQFIAAPVATESDEWLLLFFMPPDAEQLIVYSILPVEVGAAHRANVAMYLTMANFGLSIGNFELDVTDGDRAGEVRYKTSIDVTDGELSSWMIRNLVAANIETADLYCLGLQEAAAGRAAAECLATVEST